MLFTLSPKLRFYNAKPTVTGKESSYQWLNARAYGLPHGLGMGGTLEGFRFFIPDTLEGCVANSIDTSFEPGLLVPDDKFEIDVLEIWGCGGHEKFEKAMQAQQKNREIMEENISKARKVDRAQFFNNTFDQEFLLPNTMAHKRESQESSGNS